MWRVRPTSDDFSEVGRDFWHVPGAVFGALQMR